MFTRHVKPFTGAFAQRSCKLTYMAERKQPTPFSIARGHYIKRARLAHKKSQGDVASAIGVTREAISQYESGKILTIDLGIARKFILELGLKPEELLEDPDAISAPDELPEITAEARKIAYAWGDIPQVLQQYLMGQVQIWQDLKARSPALAQLLKSAPGDPSHHARIEKYQANFRLKHPPKKSKKTES